MYNSGLEEAASVILVDLFPQPRSIISDHQNRSK